MIKKLFFHLFEKTDSGSKIRKICFFKLVLKDFKNQCAEDLS